MSSRRPERRARDLRSPRDERDRGSPRVLALDGERCVAAHIIAREQAQYSRSASGRRPSRLTAMQCSMLRLSRLRQICCSSARNGDRRPRDVLCERTSRGVHQPESGRPRVAWSARRNSLRGPRPIEELRPTFGETLLFQAPVGAWEKEDAFSAPTANKPSDKQAWRGLPGPLPVPQDQTGSSRARSRIGWG